MDSRIHFSLGSSKKYLSSLWFCMNVSVGACFYVLAQKTKKLETV